MKSGTQINKPKHLKRTRRGSTFHYVNGMIVAERLEPNVEVLHPATIAEQREIAERFKRFRKATGAK